MTVPRILIVDDNVLNVELVTFVLGAKSCDVASSPDAPTALRKIESFKPDLILKDVQMPGMDGLELTRFIKADKDMRHIVVIAFTAYAMKGDEAKMRAAGCDGYIPKPINVTTFARDVLAHVKPPPA